MREALIKYHGLVGDLLMTLVLTVLIACSLSTMGISVA